MKLVDISGNKKKEYLKARLDELETNSKTKNIRDLHRGTNDFKKGCQPRTNIVKDKKNYLFTDSHSILARRMNYFSQLLNVRGVNDVRQTEICTAEPLVPGPRPLRSMWLLKNKKEINHQVLIKSQQNKEYRNSL